MTEASESWYMRARGRILGPFTLAQIVSLRDRGQLSQFHEVSNDRRSWMTAGQVPELFAGLGSVGLGPEADAPIYSVADDPGIGSRDAAVEPAPGWFYALGSDRGGPVPLVELQRLADAGAIGPFTLVWRSGLPDWTAAHQIPELRFSGTAGTSPGAPIGPVPQSVQIAANQATQPVVSRTSGLAIASLVLGILVLCGIGSLLATIFGAVALNQISQSKGAADRQGHGHRRTGPGDPRTVLAGLDVLTWLPEHGAQHVIVSRGNPLQASRGTDDRAGRAPLFIKLDPQAPGHVAELLFDIVPGLSHHEDEEAGLFGGFSTNLATASNACRSASRSRAPGSGHPDRRPTR